MNASETGRLHPQIAAMVELDARALARGHDLTDWSEQENGTAYCQCRRCRHLYRVLQSGAAPAVARCAGH